MKLLRHLSTAQATFADRRDMRNTSASRLVNEDVQIVRNYAADEDRDFNATTRRYLDGMEDPRRRVDEAQETAGEVAKARTSQRNAARFSTWPAT